MNDNKNPIQARHEIMSTCSIPSLPVCKAECKRILISSPDGDLEASLTMLLEDRFTTVMETDWNNLSQQVQESSPAVLLVDLPLAPSEGLRQIQLLKTVPSNVPIILLRNYRSNQAMDAELTKLGAFVFFKPVDVEKITGLITELMDERKNSDSGGSHGTATTQ